MVPSTDIKQGKILKNRIFWILIMITGLAIIIRSIPGWTNAAWGCDFGIYLGLTKSVSETGIIFPAYTGWGSSYNEFPVLYSINSFAHWITGIDILVIMPKLTPIFGGLSVLIFYFVTRELLNDKKIALLSALFFAVIPFHVYQTSHASPLTIGHFFMMFSIFLFLKYRKNSMYIIPLIISTTLLIMSHHLTTYFFLIILIFIVFLENIRQKKWTLYFKKDILYILIASLITFSYWAFIATTVYEGFMRSGLSIGGIRLESIFIVGIFYAILFVMFWLIKVIRKYNNTLKKFKAYFSGVYKKIKLEIIIPILSLDRKNDYEAIGSIYWFDSSKRKDRFLLKFTLTLIISVSLMTIFTFINIPWINSKFTLESVILTLPFLIIIAFGVAGFGYTWRIKNGTFICGWMLAVLLSFMFSLSTDNNILLPHRHVEYMMAPLAIIAVFGFGGLFLDPKYKKLLSKIKRKKSSFLDKPFQRFAFSRKNPILQLLLIFIIITSLAATPYLAHKSLKASDERITTQSIAVFEWMSENLDKNLSMIASDHRLARMVEAYGFNTTKDETEEIWEAENLDEYINELLGIGMNHSRITHVVIDNIMKNDVVHVHFGKVRYMINETREDDSKYASYYKFLKPPFNLKYRNESLEIDPVTEEPLQWTEIFEVNWTYIETRNYIN
jgi:hypothetical protein